MTKISLIIGSNGQDGKILFEQLTKKGHHVVACTRDAVLGSEVSYPKPDLGDARWVANLISDIQPTDIYYLAAVHHSAEGVLNSESAAFSSMMATNVLGLVNVLDGVRLHSPLTRTFYAASAHIFGVPSSFPQSEESPIKPTTPYGISKSAGLFACRRFREEYGLFAVSGILYNHESSLRSSSFLSAKLARGVAEIKLGRQKELIIGNLDAMVDWGYAPDYTSAMTLMLEQEIPNDFIVATGIAHSVRQFAEVAFDSVGLDFKNYIKTNPSLIQRDHGILVGDPSRLKSATGWNASINFDAMVHQLVREQLNAVEQTLFS